MKHRSIGERMQRAKSLAARREAALDWAANWTDEHTSLIRGLERTVGQGRVDEAGRLLGQLKAMSEKRMGALPGVICALADEDAV